MTLWTPFFMCAPRLLNVATLETQAVVHCNCDFLLGPKITLGGLGRAVTQQELDLLEIPTAFPAELGAGPAKVMGPEVLDSDLPGRLLDHRPDRPVTEPCSQLATFADAAQESPSSIFAAVIQALMPCLTQSGMATVGMRLPFPSRSASKSNSARSALMRKPDLLRGLPWRAQADGKSFVQLQVFASSGLRLAFQATFTTAMHLRPPQAWAWAKACL